MRRAQAESALKALCKQRDIPVMLLMIVRQSESAEVRLLGSQTLRRSLKLHWRQLSKEAQTSIKTGLLEALSAEPVTSVRRGLSIVVATIAQSDVPAGEWPQLLPWLHHCTQSTSEAHRETALVLLCSLTETIGEYMRPHFGALVQVTAAGLRDSSHKVRAEALQAVSTLVQWVGEEPEIRMFRDLVPSMLQMAQMGLASGDEQTVIDVCELFIDLIEASAPVMGPVIPDLVRWCMQVTTTTSYDLATREMTLQVVEWLARYKPKQLAKSGTVRPVVAALCALCAEPEPADHDNDDQLSASKFAAQAIDVLALNLPSKHVLPEALSYAQTAIQSPDPLQRAAACTVIVDVAEGCADAVRKQLPVVLQIVGTGARDSEAKVRGQAMFALGELAGNCQPEMSAHAREALPCVFAAMAEDNPTLQQQACYALDSFCEHLEEEITEFLEPLLARLSEVLGRRGSVESQLSALGAISSAASAAGSGFQPYAAAVLPLLRSYMNITEEEMLPCRARATEAVGIIACAVGKDAMGGSIPDFVGAALQGMALDHSELREYTNGMLGHLAETLGEEFAPFLPNAVQAAIASCSQDDGVAEENSDEEGTAETKSESIGSDDEADEEVDDEDEEDASRRLNVRTGVLDEKAAATQALGAYAKATLAHFAPYIAPTLPVLLRMAAYFHDDVREQAYEALSFLVAATTKAFPANIQGEVSPQAAHVVEETMPVLLQAVEKDDDKEAVSVAVTAASEIVRGCGAKACAAQLPALIDAVGKVARGEALCQVAESEDDEPLEDEEEQEENPDENLLVAVGDALPILARALGPDAYAPIFAQHHANALLKWTRSSQPDAVRAAGVGALAEVAKELGGHMAPYTGKLMPMVLRELRHESAANRRNAAFATGVLVQAAPAATAPHLPNLLQALHPLFRAEEDAGTRDNAAGAVGRIIATVGSQVPLEQVLPVLLGALPLQEDIDESEAVYGSLCGLLLHPDTAPRVAPYLPQTLQVLGAVLTNEAVEEAVRRQVAHSLMQLQSQQGNAGGSISALLTSLPPDQRNALAALASHAA
ncbi:Importin-4 [Coccomyxa sp. Obi]|nr:Importin-4 [Coccomyxa sp. Obi]